MDHKIIFLAEEEMFSAIRAVKKTLKVFDPVEARNSVAIFVGLKPAKENGINGVMTGDGLDELFAGYSWLFERDESELRARLSYSVEHVISQSIVKDCSGKPFPRNRKADP